LLKVMPRSLRMKSAVDVLAVRIVDWRNARQLKKQCCHGPRDGGRWRADHLSLFWATIAEDVVGSSRFAFRFAAVGVGVPVALCRVLAGARQSFLGRHLGG